ncbi:PREDICTED: protein FAR1-RELATED SEQUENCE 5-like [Populus euphratica]|uniref:Protein FAR1-RELATED SEQUENCE 5-like n=1 Tax=Populus euphratica TaxID=75702 RepID=A0AAJ6XBY4_POPEU|nr:PREDICTED: protein FAR1-RELATED SEQUENCE 5-like [Populus euphratica]
MVFESENAARVFYDEYAKRERFLTPIVSSRKSEHDGTAISRRLACNKEGFNLSSQKTGQVKIRKREGKRESCMAMILVKREKLEKWVVTKFMREHNHPMELGGGVGWGGVGIPIKSQPPFRTSWAMLIQPRILAIQANHA